MKISIKAAWLASLCLSPFALAQAPQTAPPPAPASESDALRQQLELLRQRLDALEAQNKAATQAAAEAQAAAAAAAAEAKAANEAAAAPAAPPEPEVDPWLVADNWNKIVRGSDESIVKGLLGRPLSISPAGSVTTWTYEDPEQPALGRGSVRFMKGRGAVDWTPPPNLQ